MIYEEIIWSKLIADSFYAVCIILLVLSPSPLRLSAVFGKGSSSPDWGSRCMTQLTRQFSMIGFRHCLNYMKKIFSPSVGNIESKVQFQFGSKFWKPYSLIWVYLVSSLPLKPKPASLHHQCPQIMLITLSEQQTCHSRLIFSFSHPLLNRWEWASAVRSLLELLVFFASRGTAVEGTCSANEWCSEGISAPRKVNSWTR